MWRFDAELVRGLVLAPLILIFGEARGRAYLRTAVWSGVLLGGLLIVLLIGAVVYEAARP